MPELPEVETWVRELDPLVSAHPIERAGPAHVATLKTIDPPLSALEGQRLAGAERRAKNLVFPTEDGDLVLRVHLMSAGRIRYLKPGAKGPKRPMFRLRFSGGGELILTEGGKKKRAGVWLTTPDQLEADLAHLGPDALLGPASTGPRYRRLRGAREVEEVGTLGVVELERPRQCLQHALRDPAHISALQAGVVRNAHAGQDGDLLPAEPGHAATAEGDQPRLLGRDPGTARRQEVSDLLFRVHEISVDAAPRHWGTLPVALSTGTLTSRSPVLSWMQQEAANTPPPHSTGRLS